MSLLTRLGDLDRSPGDPKVLRTGPGSLTVADQAARALGYFSIALGVAELFGGRRIAATLGLKDHAGLVRAYGAREIASGMMTLAPGRRLGVVSRVIGDGLDAATLIALRNGDARKARNADLALAAVLGIALIDIACALALTAQQRRTGPPRDYSDRSGFPQGLERARGAAALNPTPS